MSHARTGRALTAVLGATMLVATACSGGTATGSPTPSTAASATPAGTEAPQQGGRIIEGTISDIATMQPVLVNDTSSGRITALIYDSLIQQDAKSGEVKPRMATYTTSSDGLTYSFTINDKANWSDGKPVIAQDWLTGIMMVGKSGKTVRKSNFQDILGFNEYCAPAGPQCKATATTITGVTIDSANPKKFSVKMTKVSCPAILDLGANQYTLPTQVFGKYVTATSKAEDIDNAPENTSPTVFSGPFTFKEWRKGDQVILGKNASYWQGAPNVDEYVYKVVANTTAITNGLKTGELTFGGIVAKDLADMQTVDTVKLTKYQSLGYNFIAWNTASPTAIGLADKRVRQALAYGLDMNAIIKAVVFGEATKQVAHHVPVQWAYPSTPLEPYNYDKAKAQQLLKDAGWTPGADGILVNGAGKKFNLTISTNSGNTERETFIQVAADQYKQLGINAVAKPEAFQGLVTKLTTGDQTLEATTIGWSLGGDPDPYVIWHSSQIPDPAKNVTGFGFSFFKDAAMDKAIEQGRNPTDGNCSTAARKANYETFNKILNENQPYNFGYSSTVLAVSQKTLQSFDPGSFSTIWNVYQWWIKK